MSLGDPPPPPGLPGARRTNVALVGVWGAAVFLVAVLVVLLIARRGGPAPAVAGPDTATPASMAPTLAPTSTPNPTPTPTFTVGPDVTPSPDPSAVPTDPVPIADSESEVVLAGGVLVVPVPAGWTVLERGDRPDAPGGHPEVAVVGDRTGGIELAAYVLDRSADPAAEDAGMRATERAREWTRDATSADVGAPRSVAPFGSIVAMATVAFRYQSAGGREGELLFAVRSDGRTVLLVADAAAGTLEGARSAWGPARDGAMQSFGRR